MSSEITRSERKLIDEALAAGKAKVIQRGTSGLDADYYWNGTKLVARDPKPLGDRFRASMIDARRKGKSLRQSRIREIFAQRGPQRAEELSELMSVAISTIFADLREMGIAGETAPPAETERMKAAKLRRAQVADMRKRGWLIKTIAQHFGVNESMITSDLKALGMSNTRGARRAKVQTEA